MATVGTFKSTGLAKGGAVSHGGRSGVSNSGKSRRTGGKPHAAKRLVLSVTAGNVSDRGTRSSSDDVPLSVSGRTKRVIRDSSDE